MTTVVNKTQDRIDAPLKVTGSAPYPSDDSPPNLAHAVLVGATIAAGRISSIEWGDAPGVLAVLTHENTPKLAVPPVTALGPPPRYAFTDDQIVHYGQHVAVVVAQTWEQAVAAARLVRVSYDAAIPVLDLDDPRAEIVDNGWDTEVDLGDTAAALSAAEVSYDETFDIAAEANNPMGLFSTVAAWDGDRLLVHDCSQWPMMTRQALAAAFGLPEENVRVLVPYLGGGFGSGLRTWSHTLLAALAAKTVGRPVKLVLSRPQMFTSVGHRARSRQRLRIGATRDGRLTAIDHESTASIGAAEDNFSAILLGTPHGYSWPNVTTHDRQVRLNIPNPGFMRAPGHAEANFAIESALDELAYRLDIDPVELRLRNVAEVHPRSGLPWSSNALRECYRVGAERFGWRHRDPRPRSMRDGNWLIGYGMAGVTFDFYAAPSQARITVRADGTAVLRAAATDIGTGTYTIAAQQVAELLGLRVDQVRVELGDSDLPPAPQSGGSGLAVALTGAIQAAATNLRQELGTDEPFTETLARRGLTELSADGELDLAARAENAGMAPAGAFAARFVEVRVDEDLGLPRVTRVVSVVDGGRILNEKTARSQIIGGTVMGIGMAMFEDVVFDHDTGRVANATLGDYLVPVNADVPDLDVVFVGEPDAFSPTGVKGLGEVGVVGVAAAIANAVHHATGHRHRSLPITIDQLL